MEPEHNNQFDATSREADGSQRQDGTAFAPFGAPQSRSGTHSHGEFVDPASRRRFLRATVAAGAVVTGVVAAGSVVYAAQGPRILTTFTAGSATPSGHCVEIVEGVKGSQNNPNQHIQVSKSDFLAYIGTISGNTFTIVHGVAVLVDKNGHNPNFSTCIKSAAYKNGDTNVVSLLVMPGVTTMSEYPAKSCLYVNQSLGTC